MTTASMRTPSLKSALPSPSSGPALTGSRSTRRLRGSGSVKGAQSPGLFSSVGRRQQGRGSGFEAAEPTSPKVTCIGQVRVKTGRKMMRKKKKKVAALNRSRSRRAAAGGDMGYRRAGVQGGICDAVRSFGSEINCFLLCGAGGGARSSVCCSGTEDRDKEEAAAGGGKRVGSSSCGATFARWIMAVHETDGEVRKRTLAVEQEDVIDEVGGTGLVEDNSDDELVEKRFSRGIRALELLADELEKGRDFTKDGFGGGFVDAPACAPPKNALLLMRCRADPVKLSALENRFRETKVEVEDEEQEQAANVDGSDGRAKDAAAFTPHLEDRKFAPTVTALGATARPTVEVVEMEESDSEKRRSRKGTALEGAGVDQEESLMHKSSSFPVTTSEKSSDTMEDSDEPEEEAQESSFREETHDGQEDADKEEKLVLVESLDVADDPEAEKENKEVIQLPLPREKGGNHCAERAEKKLIRRDLLLASGRMEGGRWSFSKERDSSVGVRRHSFSTEGARRSSSFRENEGTRRSSFSGDPSIRRSSSYSSADRDAVVGRRGRRSISKEKDHSRRRSVDESEVPAAKKPLEGVTESGVATAATSSTTCRGAGGRGVEVSVTVAGGQGTRMRRVGGGAAAGEEGDDESNEKELPDCLRLMMYEPKLSMEISRETWVCTDDFQRWKPHQNRRRPQRQQHCRQSCSSKTGEEAEEGKGAAVVEAAEEVALEEERAKPVADYSEGDHDEDGATKRPAVLLSTTADVTVAPPLLPTIAVKPRPPLPPQPPSAPPELATATKSAERKLGSGGATAAIAAAFGPFVLTRCKSEPMRTSPRLLLPEDYCFWKSRHHHHHAVGAAGIGFGF